MKKTFLFFKLLFFSVFATTKMLANVEEDIAKLNGEKSPTKQDKETYLFFLMSLTEVKTPTEFEKLRHGL